MADERVIAVTGATGGQGGAVTRALLDDGWRVRALTRKPSGPAARRLAELGAEVTGADMADRAALEEVFRGAYGVYSVQNPMISGLDGEVAQGRNVAAAAKAAGVAHLVYGSAGPGVAGTGVGSWESKLVVEEYLRQLEVPVTVLRPMAFMELMTDKRFYPQFSTWSLMPRLMGADRPVLWLCLDDLGAIAALVFSDPARFLGADLRLASDVLSIDDARGVWHEVAGRRPRSLPIPEPLFKRFVGDDLPAMWRWLRTHPVEVDPGETRALLPGALSVRRWVERQASRPR